MMRPRNALQFATVGLVLVALACSENSPTAPDPGGLLAARAQFQGPGAPSQAELNRLVPGFGGFFLDRDGTPTIYLTPGADRGAAEQALGAYLTGRGLTGASLRVREGDYRWQQLENWHAAATPAALALAGVVFVDNDETSNRVLIGVENLGAMAGVRAAVTRAGVPQDALILERADPIVQLATLRDRIRPVQAGLQIHFGNFLCSIGFNATDGGKASFVTASHCTGTQGSLDGIDYFQPLSSVDPAKIADEVEDPGFFKNRNGCSRGRKCRYSDAARAAYVNPGDMALGRIAQTTGANNGSLTLNGTFSITQDDCNAAATLGGCLLAGTTVNKVGRTTGWTRGNISNTCVNTGVSGTNIVQLCQTFVNAGVGGGDSGSDVFVDLGGNNAKLAGVLWGGNSNGTMFVFSPLGNVLRELGSLVTH